MTHFKQETFGVKLKKTAKKVWKHKPYYFLMLPAIIYVAIFNYGPMYGIQIAFKNFKPVLGYAGSPWVGFLHFINFLKGPNFLNLVINTLSITTYSLLVGFPIPIILALLLNEVQEKVRKPIQTILYAPHFISTVVMVGILNLVLSPSIGLVNNLIAAFGGERIYFMVQPSAFRHVYVWSGIWQNMGWNAIIYIAALSTVDESLHEAAKIDGASRLQRIRYINIPTILPTIVIALIMRIGSIASLGYEKVYLLQNDLNTVVSEIISTYVYKRGIINTNYSFSAAVGLFNNLVNIAMLITANFFARKTTETSLF